MSEWKECTIGELCSNICSGGTPNRSNDSFYNNGNIPWLNTKEVSFNRIYQTENFITELGLKNSAAKRIPQNTVVVAMYGATAGKSAIVKIPVTTNQACCNLTIDGSKADYRFVYYSLFNRYEHLASLANGGAQQNLNAGLIREFKISVPELETQTKIADILSSLDDKIELNNQINRNLEEQAQAIFKSWFIDFEPFGGEMPSDWENGKLSDLGTVVAGGTPSKARSTYYTDNGIAWITPKDLSLHPNKFTSKGEIDITQEGYDNSSAKIMPKGTVLFSSRAPIGYISIAQNEICTNQGFKSLVPKVNVGTPYVYFYLKNHTEEIENKASGSTFKEASGSLMNGLEAIIPSDQILSKFNSLCKPIFEQQESLELENQRLVLLRDNLLPKLMSGELDVADARI